MALRPSGGFEFSSYFFLDEKVTKNQAKTKLLAAQMFGISFMALFWQLSIGWFGIEAWLRFVSLPNFFLDEKVTKNQAKTMLLAAKMYSISFMALFWRFSIGWFGIEALRGFCISSYFFLDEKVTKNQAKTKLLAAQMYSISFMALFWRFSIGWFGIEA